MRTILIFALHFISFSCYSQSFHATVYKQHWYGGASLNSGTIYSINIECDSSELSKYSFLSTEIDGNTFLLTETSIKHRSSISITFCFEIFHNHREIIHEKMTEIEMPVKKVSNSLTFICDKLIQQIPIDSISELFPIHYP